MPNDNKLFPIQGAINSTTHYEASSIPWWLAEEAYEYYSKLYGFSQSLERLAERGGFGREELLWLLRCGDK